MERRKVWQLVEGNKTIREILSRQLGLSRITGQILANRGIYTVDEAKIFLYGTLEQLHNPYQMKDVDKAVVRINRAVKEGEPILVYGDYDVDGITGTVLLLDVLEALGAKCGYYIPERLTEGYGLNSASLRKARNRGYKLILTVDCGISSFEEIEEAKELELDVIVTDHHEPPGNLPQALAVLNPKQRDCPYPFKDLAGVGVGFKLAQAIFMDRGQGEKVFSYLDLVALGTIADIVPLIGENRILTKFGLESINQKNRIGVSALTETAGFSGQRIEAEQVAFGLAPRLNAAGRVSHASAGVELLREQTIEKAMEMARALDKANRDRQSEEAGIYEEAVAMIEKRGLQDQQVLVLAHEGWHLGTIGIVASKLMNRYYRPVIILSIEGEEAKGSARSIPDFNMFEALQFCEEYLTKYGGHSQAAGLTLATAQITALDKAINKRARALLTEEMMREYVTVDGEVSFDHINSQLFDEVTTLAPFGQGNPSPLLVCRQTDIVEHRTVGSDGKHLKLKVQEQSFFMDAIGFNLACCVDQINGKDKIDLLFELQKNHWNGRCNLQLNLKDLKPSEIPDNPFEIKTEQGEEQEEGFVDMLFNHAVEFLTDDYYRNVGERDEFYTKIVGVTFDNRQELVALLKEGEGLYLVREPENTHDSNAVRVENHLGQQLGYLNSRLAKHFSPLLDRGEQYLCLVSGVTGGQEKNFGANIIIRKIVEEDFEERQAFYRETRRRFGQLDDEALFEAIRAALLGNNQYRVAQLEAINSLVKGNNTLAVFGTGRGKSAVFQTMAALKALRDKELTVIVYPLRALANDQYEAMSEKMSVLGLRIYKGNGSLSAGERATLFAALETGEVDIMLTTPEFLSFHMRALQEMPKKIGLFVVDESHHISTASQSHRPAYKKIGHIAEGLGAPLSLAVTATAKDEVAQEIIDALAVTEVVIDPHVRTNLHLVDKRGIIDKNSYLKTIAGSGGKTIIYVNSRHKAVELACFLREAIPEKADFIAYYHAGLKNEHRHTIERMLKHGGLEVVVATSAFGEGIDIPDVRHVVLYHLNFNFTEFNQQSGRAGRDGKTSHIHLVCGQRDVKLNEFILEMTAPDRNFLGGLYKLLLAMAPKNGPISVTNREIAEKLKKAGISTAKESSISAALGIMEEIGIIQREIFGRDRQIYLFPPGKEKSDLNNSLRYLEGQEEKLAFEEFGKVFFDSSSEELLAVINRPIYPTEWVVPSKRVFGT